jgi:hypothetical protein
MTPVHVESPKRRSRPTHDACRNHATPLKPIKHSHAAQNRGSCMAESAERAFSLRQTAVGGHCVTLGPRWLLLVLMTAVS